MPPCGQKLVRSGSVVPGRPYLSLADYPLFGGSSIPIGSLPPTFSSGETLMATIILGASLIAAAALSVAASRRRGFARAPDQRTPRRHSDPSDGQASLCGALERKKGEQRQRYETTLVAYLLQRDQKPLFERRPSRWRSSSGR